MRRYLLMYIGVCARNDYEWPEVDFHAIASAPIQLLKTMSHSSPVMYEKARAINPDIQFIVRLYDPSFGVDHHPSPEDFVGQLIPVIRALKNYTSFFQIHNEPNHPAGYEGWRSSSDYALNFKHWYLETLTILRIEFPGLKVGFPGLAIPHNDLEWLAICKEAIEESDWLGVHAYWQYDNHLHLDWGLRFYHYVDTLGYVPEMHILEGGNSNMQNNIPLPETQMADQLMEFYAKCNLSGIIQSV